MGTRKLALGMVAACFAVACGSAHDSDPGTDDLSGGTGGATGSFSTGSGGSGSIGTGIGSGSGGSSSGGAVTDGAQLAECMRNSDCSAGLNCYTFGRYCSKQCSSDTDCSALGTN